MKKFCVLTALTFLLVFSFGVSAQELELVGGVTYNTFDLTIKEDGEKLERYTYDDLKKGTGYYIAGVFNFNDKLGLEVGYDTASASGKVVMKPIVASSSSDEWECEGKLSGPYGRLSYALNEMVKLIGGIFYYNLDTTINYENKDYDLGKASGMGYLVGGKINIPLKGDLSLIGDVNYRIADLEITDRINFYTRELEECEDMKINMNGLRAGIGLSYNF